MNLAGLLTAAALVWGPGCSRQSPSEVVEPQPPSDTSSEKEGGQSTNNNPERGWGTRTAAPTYYRKTWAVIIGIDQYTGVESGLEPLLFAVNDAREVRDVLRHEFGYADERIRFVTDKDATKQALKETFEQWLPSQDIQKTDAVLVFYSGHGLIEKNTNDGYLAAVDSHADDLKGSCLSVAWVKDQLAALPCRHKLVILDSCYSGSLFGDKPAAPASFRLVDSPAGSVKQSSSSGERGPAKPMEQDEGKPADNLSYYLSQPAFYGMSAGRFTPVADGLGEQRHSTFTATMLQILRERADSPRADHIFTFRQMAAQVETRVANALGSRQIPDWGRLEPGDGDFIFRPSVRRQTPREESGQRKWMLRRNRYVEDLRNAQQSWERGQLDRVIELLTTHRPEDGEEDTRGFEWYYLWRLCHPDGVSLKGNVGVVHAVAFSTDGRLLAAGGHVLQNGVPAGIRDDRWPVESELKVWDVSTGRVRFDFPMHPGSIDAVAFSPDGRVLAAGGTGYQKDQRQSRDERVIGRVRLYDTATGKEIAGIRSVPLPPVRSVAFSPDGKTFAAGGGQIDMGILGGPSAVLGLWDASTWQARFVLNGHTNAITSLAFAPESGHLATGSYDGTVRIWDVSTGKDVGILSAEGRRVVSVAFSPKSPLLTVGTVDGSITRWDIVTGQKFGDSVKEHRKAVSSLAFAPDGNTLASGSLDGTVNLLDLTAGRSLAMLPGYPYAVHGVAFSPDGRTVAVATGEEFKGGEVKLFDISRELAHTASDKHTKMILCMEFAPDDSTLATCSADKSVRLWDVRTGRCCATIQSDGQVEILAFDPSGRILAMGGTRSPFVKSRDRNTGEERIFIESAFEWDSMHQGWYWQGDPTRTIVSNDRNAKHAAGPVGAIIFSPDGKKLLTAGKTAMMELGGD